MNIPVTSTLNHLIVVDVQPGYYQACHEIIPEVIEKMNNTNQKIIFFYVGKEFNLDTKDDMIGFLLENGLDETTLDRTYFIEKEYGFFRSWMDNRIEHDVIVRAIKVMHEDKTYDSRNFSETQWSRILIDKVSLEHEKFLFEDHIFYPYFNNKPFMNNSDGFELIGGSRHECLEEINLYLKALGKKTSIVEELTYGADSFNPHSTNTGKKKKRKY